MIFNKNLCHFLPKKKQQAGLTPCPRKSAAFTSEGPILWQYVAEKQLGARKQNAKFPRVEFSLFPFP